MALGAGLAFAVGRRAARAAEVVGHRRGGQPRDVPQRPARGDRLAGDARLVEALLDERRDPLRVDDVGGEERLHLAGDLVVGVLLRLPPALGAGDLVGDLAQRRGAEVEHELEVALGGLDLVTRAQALGARGVLVGGEAQLVDLDLEVAALARAVAHQLEERLHHPVVRVGDDRGDVPVVVLERALLAVVQAALDAEDDQDHEEEADAEEDRLTDEQRLAIRWATGRPGRGRRPPRAGRRTREVVQSADHTTAGATRRTGAHASAPPGEVVLHRYRLVRRLGAGGFGVVWLAHDERLDRAVAMKRIVMHDEATAARAEREAIAAARLSHPGIVALYEAGRDDEAVYLVSELVRGRTLAQLIQEGELSDRDVLRLGIALCDALAHAHGRGVIHRDVKPGNVIVPDRPQEGAGVAKLTDFGIARMVGDDALTLTGDVVGTLAYMAPEQAEGRAVDAGADLYALALVLYEALSGVNPIRGRGAASTARRVGARLPALGRLRRDLDPELCAALDRALLPRAEQRGTLRDLRAALAEALPGADDDHGTIAGSPLEGIGRTAVPRPPVRPRARAVAGLGAGVLVA